VHQRKGRKRKGKNIKLGKLNLHMWWGGVIAPNLKTEVGGHFPASVPTEQGVQWALKQVTILSRREKSFARARNRITITVSKGRCLNERVCK
jgi:hypothetical protein